MQAALLGATSTNLEELDMWLWYMIVNKLHDWHLLHTWGRWSVPELTEFDEMTQARKCLACGKVQVRYI